MADETRERFFATHARLLEQLRARALRELPLLQGNFPANEFAEALFRSVRHRFQGSDPPASDVSDYLASLHVDDLALACALSVGHEVTWEHFIRTFRPQLYAAARAIIGRGGEAGEVSARELADSLYAELYGLNEREGQRRSLFVYFHGRSKLSTWLRAILSQRYVDSIRASRREESLDATPAASGDFEQPVRAIPEPGVPAFEPDPDRACLLAFLQTAITDAIAALDSRDRLRLAYYYAQDLTLAQIGRLTNEHEATVSRKLGRTRRHIRAHVERFLRDTKRLADAQIRLCYRYAQQEWPFDLSGVLSGERNPPPADKEPGEGQA